MKIRYLWIIFITVMSAIITVFDKYASKHFKKRRVPERNFFLLSIMGGSLGIFVTMKLIRHKTRHKRFMIGIPVIMIIQIVFLLYIERFIV